MRRLIIIGAGGHGKVVADIAQRLNKYENIAFLDDEKVTINNYSVIGGTADYKNYLSDSDFFVAIGNNLVRKSFVNKLLSEGANLVRLVHPSAIIGDDVKIDIGVVVMAGAVINPGAKLGKGVIVNTLASIDHDSVVGDFTHLSVGGRVAGTVVIGEECFLGASSVVINNVNVCSKCVLGAGAVVVKSIKEKGTYVGVPAKKIHD